MRRSGAGKALQHENLSRPAGAERTTVREPGPGFAGLLLSSALFLPSLSAKHDPLSSSWTADSKERSEFSGFFYFSGLSYLRELKEAQSRAALLCLVNPRSCTSLLSRNSGPGLQQERAMVERREKREKACMPVYNFRFLLL